jgi:hypothetical protein
VNDTKEYVCWEKGSEIMAEKQGYKTVSGHNYFTYAYNNSWNYHNLHMNDS